MSENQGFKTAILTGIPEKLPLSLPFDSSVSHAPKRKDLLTPQEKKLAIQNALRYFKAEHHTVLAREFAKELKDFGRIYMYRFRPTYSIYARPIEDYPHRSR